MKKTLVLLALPVLAAAFVLTACGGDENGQAQSDIPAADQQAATPAADPNVWHGTVAETMDSGGYTYVLLDTGSEKIWCAAPETAVAVGDAVHIPKGMLMPDFQSKTLDRTFEEIYFVSGISSGSAPRAGGMPQGGGMGGMPPAGSGQAGEAVSGTRTVLDDAEVEGVEKVAGGYTVAEIFGNVAELDGKKVKIRGRVVKFTPNIMGTNWIHIQDGTGSTKSHDLTVTTSAAVKVDDLIVVEGTLANDKDFGAGYRYPAIIENAKVTKE